MANGDQAPCHGVAPNVALTVGTEDFDLRFFGIDLGGFEVILGVEFLRTLGPILWDFDDLCMTFDHGGRCLLWRGLDSARLNVTEPATRAVVTVGEQPLLDALLAPFGAVFEEPHLLPPTCPYDHRIHLLPGLAPVAVRPYRYPQLQKDELERQCAAMLAQGIIHRAHLRSPPR